MVIEATIVRQIFSSSEPALVRALEMSGYPLQGVVAERLQLAGFEVVEEWGFIGCGY